MKKVLAIVLAFSMALALIACGSKTTEQPTTTPAAPATSTETTPSTTPDPVPTPADTEWKPAKDITIVVPYSAGGGTDVTCRALQTVLSRELGVNVIITNEPASSGTVGAQSVADAAPDGYTLLCTAAGAVCYQNHYEGVGYDLEDFTPLARISVGPELIAVRTDSDIMNYDDLVKAMQGSTLSAASTAVGAAAHVSLMSFCNDIGAEVNYVPYKSGNEAMVALLGGQVDLCVGGSQQIVGQLANGDIRIVANLGSAGGVGYEDVPLACENGCVTSIDTFNGLLGPAGMDQAIVDKLVSAIQTALSDSATIAALEAGGIELGYMGPEEFGDYLKIYNDTVETVLKSIGLI